MKTKTDILQKKKKTIEIYENEKLNFTIYQIIFSGGTYDRHCNVNAFLVFTNEVNLYSINTYY